VNALGDEELTRTVNETVDRVVRDLVKYGKAQGLEH